MNVLFFYLIAFFIWLFIGFKCADICEGLSRKIFYKKSDPKAIFVGIFFQFFGIVYYIGKYIVKKDEI